MVKNAPKALKRKININFFVTWAFPNWLRGGFSPHNPVFYSEGVPKKQYRYLFAGNNNLNRKLIKTKKKNKSKKEKTKKTTKKKKKSKKKTKKKKKSKKNKKTKKKKK